jgi:LPXTG-motif cell wall-anchored protein
MPKVPFSILQLLICSLLVGTVAACPGFSVGQTTCSSGVLTKSNLNAQCSDEEGTVYVSGTATAGSDFNANAKVSLLPCVWGTAGKICFDQYKQDAGEICNLIVNADGNDCGTAGSYTIDQTFEIPDEAQAFSSVWNVFTIKVLIDDEESCQQEADSSNAAFLMLGIGSIFVVSGLYFMKRRKKPLLVLDDVEEEVNFDGTPRHHFVEMKGYDAGRMA